MMKRPRSFISTLLIVFCLATVTAGLTVCARRVEASSLPRLMDPRAGEPDEPSSPMQLPDEGITPSEARRTYYTQPACVLRVDDSHAASPLDRLLAWWTAHIFIREGR